MSGIETDANPTIILEREIRNQVAGLRKHLSLRKDHPTFGYTKADAWGRYHTLVGMLYAWSCLVWGPGGSVALAAAEAAAYLGVCNLRELHDRIAAA